MSDKPNLGNNKPRFIAVEGPIGVGKTSLTKRLADTFNYEVLLEQAQDNPFLDRFYQNPQQYALATQLHFLFQRTQQLQELRQDDLFEPVRVADFLMDKDRLFAQLNLDRDELEIYLNVYRHLTINTPTPDLVIYLQAPTEVLLNRIQKRGIPSEQLIEKEYLENLNSAYTEYFHYYDRSKLLIVNSTDLDLVDNDAHYQELLDYLLSLPSGTHYYNPGHSFL